MQPFNKHLAGEIGFLITLRMAKNLNTALLQANLEWENIQQNVDHFEEKIQELSEDVDLIILPEMFSTGFSMNAKNLAEPANGPTFEMDAKNGFRKRCGGNRESHYF